MVNNYSKMREMESVLTLVLPAGITDWDEYRKEKAKEPDFVIEEMTGSVYPTEALPGETGRPMRARPWQKRLLPKKAPP